MARLARYGLPDQPQHVIQRGNNRGAVFFTSEDRRLFLDWLGEAAERHGCAVHAYVLMTNHFHLLLTPREPTSIARTLQSVGRRYVRHVNTARGRTGTLWEGRYRATVIDADAYFLACSRYIELNPVRAGLARRPADYPWSSHRGNAYGEPDPLLTPHPLYAALGGNPAGRQEGYRQLFGPSRPIDPGIVEAIRSATNGGWALGDAAFRDRIAGLTGRRAAPLLPGRLRRKANETDRNGV